MRLLGVLALAAPVAVGLLLLAAPGVTASWVDVGLRPVLAALLAALIGVSLTAVVVAARFRYRFSTLSKAAERIAGGDFTTRVEIRGSGLEARMARAINGT